jgi:hypothetical protein
MWIARRRGMPARLVAGGLGFWLVSLAAVAAAAPRVESPTEPQHGVDVIAEANAGLRSHDHIGEPIVTLGFSAFWRVTPRLAVGATAGRGFLGTGEAADVGTMPAPDGRITGDQTLLLFGGGAIRYDYAAAPEARAWVRGDVGVGFASDDYVNFDHGTYVGTATETRRAPFVGLWTGGEVRPVRFVSMGFRGGVDHFAFSASAGRGASVSGPMPAILVGLDLGVHIPD